MRGNRPRTWLAATTLVLIMALGTFAGRTIYVDADAIRANDGSSWTDAYQYLQDALADANSAAKPLEIRVAQGIYKPDQGANQTPGDREATFQLTNGVTLKGGYAGFGAPDPNHRDVDVYATILSGDLEGNDVGVSNACDLEDEPTRAENSYHVVTASDCDETAVLDGFSISAGNADGLHNEPKGHGGALYGLCGSPTVMRCRFIGNVACRGVGVYNGYRVDHFGGNPTLIGCTFSANRADDGGGIYNRSGSVILTSCVFIGNAAASEGGGMYVNHSPVMLNCVFSGNLADVGGAIFNRNTSPILTNCTFSKNKANYRAGAIYICPGRPSLYNCIVWDNSDGYGTGESSQIYSTCGGASASNYCCIQGWTGSLEGADNIDADPLFVDADGADNVPGTEDDNLRLLAGSPCVDAGDNSAAPASLSTDLDGNPRIMNGIVDMGAYEGGNQGFLFSAKSVKVPEAGTTTFGVSLAMDPLGTVEATVAVGSGDPDITLESGGSLVFDSSDYSIPQAVTLAAADDDDYLHGQASISVSAPGFFTAEINATEQDQQAPSVLYVDDSAQGANVGTSWLDAFTYLQDAIRVAKMLPEVAEIRVAQGIYKPDQGTGVTPGDRQATFQLVNGVRLKGGYAGFGEPDPGARDPRLYQSILSGDLADNDAAVDDPFELQEHPSRADNSFRVVAATVAGPGALLQGFVVTAALDQNPEDWEYVGSGLYVGYDANMTVQDCVFTANAAPGVRSGGSNCTFADCVFTNNTAGWFGGGMYISGGSPRIIRCTFEDNWARNGGGLCIWGEFGGDLQMEDCTFRRNVASGLRWADVGYGGALWSPWTLTGSRIDNCIFVGNIASAGGGACFGNPGGPRPPPRQAPSWDVENLPTLTACTFARNQASWGGAICQETSALAIRHSAFRQNSALYTGGAVSTWRTLTNLGHCLFSGNSASFAGGSILAGGARIVKPGGGDVLLKFILTLNNCTFRGNLAPTGRALACRSSNSQDVDSTLISNCILDNGANEIHNPDGSQITIAYTDLRGGLGSIYDPCESTSWEHGNIHADPCFADPGCWDPNGTPDDPNDDFWVDGDYHLKSQAGRWDSETQSWVKDDVMSPCVDAGNPNSPIGHEPFPNGGIINMGAYGGTVEASKSYFGEPVCETIVAGDINGDCKVGFEDFRILALHWLQGRSP